MRRRRVCFVSLPVLAACGLLIGAAGDARGNTEGTVEVLSTGSVADAQSVIEDMALVRRRLRESLLPGADPARTTAAAEANLATLRPDGSWPDQDYADTNRERWKAADHLPRLLTIARAYYQQPVSGLASRPEVKTRLLAALEHWLRADPRNDNWWHNEIGVPKQVGELLILLGDDAPDEMRRRGITLMTRSKMDKMTGQNLVWTAEIQILRGCLAAEPALVESAYSRMWEEVRYAGPGEEGIQVDASFYQHGVLLYAGGYGAGFTADVTRFVNYARGTRFALPEPKQAILERYVLDGQQWMVRGGQWDYGVTGRELIRPGKSAAGQRAPVETLAQITADTESPRRQEMADFAARLQGKPDAPPLIGNRHYWLSDYMAHHRAGYFAANRMFSTRTVNTDGLTNGENKTSHHLADGAMYLARDGQEYVGIYPVWDWHRIPGTTVEQGTTLVPEKVRRRGTTRFVGGVSDGRYGCAAMDLATGELRAQKAWFYFDDEVVCLGAGITCSTPNRIATTLNQTLLRGPVETSLRPGEPLARGERDLAGGAWVWHAGIGYVLPKSVEGAHLRNDTQTGSLRDIGPGSPDPISKDVFSLWIDHGATPRDASYAYILLPDATAAETARAAAASPVEVGSNTAQLQSVWHTKLGLLAAAFRAPGGIARGGPLEVSADAPCLLLAQRSGDKLRLSVANPLNEPLTLRVTINLPLEGDGASRGPSARTSQVAVELPGGLEAGRSVVREFAIRR